MQLWVAVVVLGLGCGGRSATSPQHPTPGKHDSSTAAIAEEQRHSAGSNDDSVAPDPTESELGAINEALAAISLPSQLCWALAAANDGYELAGTVKLALDIAPVGRLESVSLVDDGLKSKLLNGCLIDVAKQMKWPAGLAAKSIVLPLQFIAPRWQNVIDRRLVVAASNQGAAQPTTPRVAVLLDARNSGNSDASMFALTFARGATTELRKTDRTELWWFQTAAVVTTGSGSKQRKLEVAAGDIVRVPQDSARSVTAREAGVAIVMVAPGRDESVARLGSLPTPLVAPNESNPALATMVAASSARSGHVNNGSVAVLVNDGPISASVLELDAGATVPVHSHEGSSEYLYVVSGSGKLDVSDIEVPITEYSVVQIAKGLQHSFVATSKSRLLQFYTPTGPSGPQARFLK